MDIVKHHLDRLLRRREVRKVRLVRELAARRHVERHKVVEEERLCHQTLSDILDSSLRTRSWSKDQCWTDRVDSLTSTK